MWHHTGGAATIIRTHPIRKPVTSGLTRTSRLILTGHDGCNQFTGQTWFLDGEGGPDGEGVVRCHGDRIQTLKACIDVDTWLSAAETFVVDGEVLRARAADGSDVGTLVRG